MTAINPKLEFKLRTLQNWAICLFGFALWAWLVSPLPFRLLANAVGIAVAYYILFYVLDKRASLIPCPNCGKQVATNTPWVCGVCGKHNLRVDDFPFTHKCEECGIEPKAYRCHHPACLKLIFFSEDKQEVNFAYCLNAKEQTPPPDKRAERAEQKEEMAHAIELEELDGKLEAIRKSREKVNQQPKPLDEEIHDDLERHFTRWMGYEAHAKKKRAMVDAEFKDDPEGRQKAHEIIDNWLKEKM